MSTSHSKKPDSQATKTTTTSKQPAKEYTIYFKHDGCSMRLFKDKMTFYTASNRKRTLEKIYSDWKGSFIITK